MNVGKRLVDILDKYLRFSKQDRDAVHQLISGLEDKPKALGVSVRNTITEIRSGNVIIDYANGVTLVNPDTGKRSIFLDSNGNAYFGSNTELPSTTSLVIFSNWKTYSGELLSAGDVLLGDNTPNKANLLWDRSTGKLLFRSGTTTHAYVDIDGAIKAGAGHVLLDVNGITIKADTVYHDTRAVKFVDPSSNVFSHLSGRYGISTTWVYTYLINEGNATYPDSFVYISSQPNTANDDAEMLLSAGLYGPCGITLKNLYGSPKEIKLDAEKAIIDVADYGLTVQADNSSVYFSAPTFQISGYDDAVHFQLKAPAGYYRWLEFQSGDVQRWRIAADNSPESSLNQGSDLAIYRYSDAGTLLGTPITISRYTGHVMLEDNRGDIFNYGAHYQDYSPFSTVTGWDSFTTKKIYYKKIGHLLYVYFHISGVAHATDTSASFTIPYFPHGYQSFVQPIRVIDGGTYKFGLVKVSQASTTISLYTSEAEAAWATSGTKDVQGWFLANTGMYFTVGVSYIGGPDYVL